MEEKSLAYGLKVQHDTYRESQVGWHGLNRALESKAWGQTRKVRKGWKTPGALSGNVSKGSVAFSLNMNELCPTSECLSSTSTLSFMFIATVPSVNLSDRGDKVPVVSHRRSTQHSTALLVKIFWRRFTLQLRLEVQVGRKQLEKHGHKER